MELLPELRDEVGGRTVKIRLDKYGIMPTRAHTTDAGLDIYSPVDLKLGAGARRTIKTGVHVQLPANTVGFIKSKSGLMSKSGITTDGTIDEGYTGEIGVVLFNHSKQGYHVHKGDKIAQLVILPVKYEPVELGELEESDRGTDGFGSTGR